MPVHPSDFSMVDYLKQLTHVFWFFFDTLVPDTNENKMMMMVVVVMVMMAVTVLMITVASAS